MTLVVLDPGHGGHVARGGASPDGARGPGGLVEKHLTLALARAVADRLRGDCRVVLTRDADSPLGLAERRARGRGAAAFVSLHFNADPDPRVRGFETWHHGHAPKASLRLAHDLHAALLGGPASHDRGVHDGPLTVLDPRGQAAPACLLELGYLSDPAEAARLAGPAHLGRLADAIAAGLRSHLAPRHPLTPYHAPRPDLTPLRDLAPHDLTPRHDLAARPAFGLVPPGDPPRVDIWHEVPLVPQLTGMSCWAAAAAMLIGWRDCVAVDPGELARGSGRWHEYQIGIEPRDIATLARVWDFEVVHVGQGLDFPALAGLLERHGPLWVGEASPGLHVVVVAGVHGDGHPDRSFVRIADPWPAGRGERYSISFTEFRHGLAAAAALSADSAKMLHNRRPRGARPGARSGAYARLGPAVGERYPGWTADSDDAAAADADADTSASSFL